MPLAVITITLDPVLRLSDTSSVRYETVAIAVVVLLGLVATAWIGSRLPGGPGEPPGAGLRMDDLVFIAVGTVPGAIVGGRLGYVLDHLDYYSANPSAVLDAAQGGLTLTLAVPLGILTGAVIARLLGAPVGRWMHVAALPMLLVLSTGKLIGVLGGTGQGAPSDLPWATSYAGPGPWGSLAAEVPAHPSQVYEAAAIAVVISLLFVMTRSSRLVPRNGAVLFVALGLWAIARILVAGTWRDAPTVGPLGMEQALLVIVLLVSGVAFIDRFRSATRRPTEPLQPGGRPPAEARVSTA